jgi:tetratricopeptide (TPR) repeat protein
MRVHPVRRSRSWSAAAAVAVVLSGALGLAACNSAGTDSPESPAAPRPADASGRTAPFSDEFGGMDFPAPHEQKGSGAAGKEKPVAGGQATVLRTRGLVTTARAGERRWRVVSRGDRIGPGDGLRCGSEGAAARLLGPDGSTVSVAYDSEVRFDGARSWQLLAGRAHFDAAAGRGSFTVDAPGGRVRTSAARFVVQAPTGAAAARCWVDEGQASLLAAGSELRLKAGQAGVLASPPAELAAAGLERAWLAALDAAAESEHGLGELLARAARDGRAEPLEIRSHRVTVTVVDQVARTFVDEVFVNNTSGRMEGVFYYTLPSEAAVSEFAMYVDGRRVTGEVLERRRARQVFEYIRRQQRDPALLEWVGGNLFKMRVFPIEPYSEKRIQLGYTQVLPRRDGRVTYTYPLVSEKLLRNPLRELAIDFRVHCSAGLGELSSPTHEVATAASDDGLRGVAAFRARNYTPKRDFTVTYAAPGAPECLAFANRRPDEADGYFMLQICPEAKLAARAEAKRVLVVVDGSASTGLREYAAAAEFAAAMATLSPDREFALVRGGQRPEPWRPAFARPEEGSTAAVREFLKARPPLGATDLLATFRTAAGMLRPGEPAEIVYVGDGVETVSELSGPALIKEIAALLAVADARVSCVALGSNCDRPLLEGLAAATGGTFLRIDSAAAAALVADRLASGLSRPALRDVRVQVEGLPTSQLHPAMSAQLPAGEALVVLGRAGKSGQARVRLTATADGRPFERTYDVELAAAEQRCRFLPRLWARAHMEASLAGMGLGAPAADARIRTEVTDLSIRYQLMSPFTAFLVLESDEDYARYGIKRSVRMLDWKGQGSGAPAPATREIKPERFFDLGIPLPFYGALMMAPPQEDPTGGWGARDAEAGDRAEAGLDLSAPSQDSWLSGKDPDAPGSSGAPAGSPAASGQDGTPLLLAIFGKRDEFLNPKPRVDWSWWAERNAAQLFSDTELAGLRLDKPPRPLAYYQRLINSGRATLGDQLNMVMVLEIEERYKQALAVLGTVLQQMPDSPELRIEEACLRYRLGEHKIALELLDKALLLAPEAGRAEKRAWVTQALGEYQDAAERFRKLALEAKTPAAAVEHAERVASSPSVMLALWDELLKRWPKSPEVAAAAGRWHMGPEHGWPALPNGDPARGVELLRRARELGGDVGTGLLKALIRCGQWRAAMEEADRVIAGARDPNLVHQALDALGGVGVEVADRRTRALLAPGTSPVSMGGALYRFIPYDFRGSQRDRDLVRAAASSPDLPPDARIRIFSLLGDVSVLRPVFVDLNTPEKLESAVQAAEASATRWNGTDDRSLRPEVDKLLARRDLSPAQRIRLLAHLLQISPPDPRADRPLLALLERIRNQDDAENAVRPLFDWYIGRYEFDKAIKLADGFAKRFPGSITGPRLYAVLVTRLQRDNQRGEAEQLTARLARQWPERAAYVLTHARLLIGKGRLDEAAAALRTGIRAAGAMPRGTTEVPKNVEDAVRIGLEACDRRRDFARLTYLLGQACAQRPDLRRAFLKEAEAARSGEEPETQPWTEAILGCLEASGDQAGQLRYLENLVAAAPTDPLWPRRLAVTYVQAGRLKDARAVLLPPSEADPGDPALVLSVYELTKRTQSPEEAERALARTKEALAPYPQYVHGRSVWMSGGWVKQPAAQEKAVPPAEAIAACFDSLLWENCEQATLDKLSAIAGDEKYRPEIESRLAKALAGKPWPRRLVHLRLLEYRLAKLKGERAAAAVNVAAYSYCTAALVAKDLLADGQADRARRYALEGGGLGPYDRYLLVVTTPDLFGDEKSLDRYRALKAVPEGYQYRGDFENLIKLLVEQKRPDEAEQELLGRSGIRLQDDYNAGRPWDHLIRFYQESGQHDRAVKLVLAGWKKEELEGRRSNADMVRTLLWSCEAALKGGGLAPETRRAVTEALTDAARLHLAGDRTRYFYLELRDPVLDQLGLRAQLDGLAAEAGRSESPVSLRLVGDYLAWRGQQAEAKRLYLLAAKKAEGQERRWLLGNMYSLYRGWKPAPDWSAARDCLEERHRWGFVDEYEYRLESGRCLYGLNRGDEARRVFRELLASHAIFRHGQEYWVPESEIRLVGEACEVAKDWEMAAEVYEAGLHLLAAWRSDNYVEQLAAFSARCANAYVQAGRGDKALELCVQGLGMVPADYGYGLRSIAAQYLLKESRRDQVIADYEKSVAAPGGRENPQLRMIFAETCSGQQEAERLRHLSIAADLLPKDLALRKSVIDGYTRLGNHPEVIKAYLAWARTEPQNLKIYSDLGAYLKGAGRDEEAMLAWGTLAEVQPQEAEGHRAYAQILGSLGMDEAAARELRKALRSRPVEYDLACELAAVYRRLKQEQRLGPLWVEGEKACRQAIADFADDPGPWLNLGRFLKEQGRDADAREVYEQILKRSWPRFQAEAHGEAQLRLRVGPP